MDNEKIKQTEKMLNLLFVGAFVLAGVILLIISLINGWDVLKYLFLLGTMLVAYFIKLGLKKLTKNLKKSDLENDDLNEINESDTEKDEKNKNKKIKVEHYDDDFWG